ncbi:linear amide C-N hydrolase [Nonomuraea sp. NN258]|uniref:linear amide C-N hydrolase n=1 Tax=Nonomuraea antri TaxID=2730852 RepID=UPI001568691E|nr:linear amide C-N hydrolase [Nonomuraea antri]NRQ30433.1 linear amide C-N hydrolase [Nonomuraea antri]
MRTRTVALSLALALCAACTACASEAASGPRTGSGAVQEVQQGREPAQQARQPLSQTAQDVDRTTASLRRLDDLPLYEMTYHGDYDAEAPLTKEELARPADGWACSLFARGTEFGRNFDWQPNPAMVVHADPPDGYASMSLVDVSYLLDGARPADLRDPGDRRRLAHAVLAPFDGVNEKGLAIGLAAAPDAELPAKDPGKVTVTGVRVIRLMLDQAATVDEAVAVMRRYNVEFPDGVELHYLIADRSGRSVVVEYGQGRLNVIDDRFLTNITMTGADRDTKMADTRYSILARGAADAKAFDLLQRVAQPHTRWSVVYDLESGTARVVTAQRWDKVLTLPSAEAVRHGARARLVSPG